MSVLIRVPGSRPKLIMRPMRAARSASAVVISPPSPTLNGFVAWKEKISVSPRPPSGRAVGVAAAEARARNRSAAARRGVAQLAPGGALLGGGAVPKVAHASTPATWPPKRSNAASRAAGSMCQPRRSMSTNTGSKPAHSIAQAVAVKV